MKKQKNVFTLHTFFKMASNYSKRDEQFVESMFISEEDKLQDDIQLYYVKEMTKREQEEQEEKLEIIDEEEVEFEVVSDEDYY